MNDTDYTRTEVPTIEEFTMRAIAIAIALFISGCGNFDRHVANITGSSESCIDGVKYLQFPSGASVKYTKSGGIATC